MKLFYNQGHWTKAEHPFVVFSQTPGQPGKRYAYAGPLGNCPCFTLRAHNPADGGAWELGGNGLEQIRYFATEEAVIAFIQTEFA